MNHEDISTSASSGTFLLLAATPSLAEPPFEWIFDPPACFGVGSLNRFYLKANVDGEGTVSILGDWGDGSAPYEATISSGVTAWLTYTYSTAGTYNVNFTATYSKTNYTFSAPLGSPWQVDDNACTLLGTDVPPTPTPRDPPMEWVVNPPCNPVGVLTRFALVVGDIEGENVTIWGDWGDGEKVNQVVYASSFTSWMEHVYETPGIYEPLFQATYSLDGAVVEATKLGVWDLTDNTTCSVSVNTTFPPSKVPTSDDNTTSGSSMLVVSSALTVIAVGLSSILIQ